MKKFFIDIENRVRRWSPFKRSLIHRTSRKSAHINNSNNNTTTTKPNTARSMSIDPTGQNNERSKYLGGEHLQGTSSTATFATQLPRNCLLLNGGRDKPLFTVPMPRKIRRKENISSSPETPRKLTR